MRSNLTEEDKSNIITQYWKGKTVSKICEEYGVSKTTVYSIIRPGQMKESYALDGKELYIQKDIKNIQQKVSRLNSKIEILSKIKCRNDSPLEERLAEFERLKGAYGINILLEALNISKGTYYNRIIQKEVPSIYLNRYKEIAHEVQKIFDESKQCYGADKILAELKAKGYRTSKKYVLRIMHNLGLESVRTYSKHDYVAQKRKNVVKRVFSVSRPNQIWVGDVSQFLVKGVFYYICVVIDLYSRKVVSYKVSSCCSTKLITATFKQAYMERGEPTDLTFHSDQGTQYTSRAFREYLNSKGITQSYSLPGRPIDNAVAESFFSSLKREELYRREYKSEREFRESVSSYIYNYNSVRPHRFNNYKTPNKKETEYIKRVSE